MSSYTDGSQIKWNSGVRTQKSSHWMVWRGFRDSIWEESDWSEPAEVFVAVRQSAVLMVRSFAQSASASILKINGTYRFMRYYVRKLHKLFKSETDTRHSCLMSLGFTFCLSNAYFGYIHSIGESVNTHWIFPWDMWILNDCLNILIFRYDENNQYTTFGW